MIDFVDLREFAPLGNRTLLQAIEAEGDSFRDVGINSTLRLCHFMAQAYVESNGFRVVEENLRYSAARLCKVWPKRFPTEEAAKPYAMNPKALAEKVYGGRMGNTEAGDGYAFRGRGIKQLTGRDNYRAFTAWARKRFDNVPDFEEVPDVVATVPWSIRSALFYWDTARCNRFADKNDIRGLTKAINGGQNGFADRREAFRNACAVWDEAETISRIGKPASQSNIGKASIVGMLTGGAAVAPQAIEAVDQASQAIYSGRGLADAIGAPFFTVVLIAIVIGLLLYILRDRIFIAKNEGL